MTGDPELLLDGPVDAAAAIVLAHCAGAAMDTPFMNFFATDLADRGFRFVRFMASKRSLGKGKPPDREPVLRTTWLRVIEMVRASARKNAKLVIGGKSMGGRIASLIADDAGVDGLVCLGYPFHPVGKPNKLRVEHLSKIKTPTLIVQGERDPFGTRDEVGIGFGDADYFFQRVQEGWALSDDFLKVMNRLEFLPEIDVFGGEACSLLFHEDTVGDVQEHRARVFAAGLWLCPDLDPDRFDSFRRFRRDQPDAVLELHPMLSNQQVEAVRSGKLDAGFIFSLEVPGGDIAELQVSRHKLMLAAPQGHAATRSKRLRLRDLHDAPFVWFHRWGILLGPHHAGMRPGRPDVAAHCSTRRRPGHHSESGVMQTRSCVCQRDHPLALPSRRSVAARGRPGLASAVLSDLAEGRSIGVASEICDAGRKDAAHFE